MDDELYLKTLQRLINNCALMSRLNLTGLIEKVRANGENDQPLIDQYLYLANYYDPKVILELAEKAQEIKTIFKKNFQRKYTSRG